MPRLNMSDHLLGRGATQDNFEDTARYAVSLAAEAIYRATDPVAPGSLDHASRIEDVDLDAPLLSSIAALEELRSLWLDHAVFYHHPRYLSHLNCPIAVPAIAADFVASTLNTAVESWDQATSAAVIEERLIAWIAGKLGLPRHAGGVFTSGGTQSNLHALAIARNKARSSTTPSDPVPVSRLAVFFSPAAHYSINRAADLLGFERHARIVVDTQEGGQMDPRALRDAIIDARQHGLVPAAVAVTAGTTDRGIIDPLADIAAVCSAESVHLHVDAAYGGVACLSREHAFLLDGIELADSVTVDFHKAFFQPVSCSALVIRNAAEASYVRHNAEYLNPDEEKRTNLADFSLQTTRRFDAAKLWVSLRTFGADAIGEAFDNCIRIARQTAQIIAASDAFELFEPPKLTTVLFTLSGDLAGKRAEPLRDALFATGTATVGVTKIDGRKLMKFTIVDPTLSANEIAEAVSAIALCAEQVQDLEIYSPHSE